MGRIKTQLIKRLTYTFVEKYGDSFTEDFAQNKEVVTAHTDGASKKIRNTIAGYVTRIVRMKRIKEE